jgi:hypothetical protein
MFVVLLLLLLFIIFIIIKYLKRHFYYYVRKQACHTAFFLKCLHNARPLDGSDSLKCLPNRPHSLKCLLNRRVTIHFPSIFGYNLVCSEFGQFDLFLHFAGLMSLAVERGLLSASYAMKTIVS